MASIRGRGDILEGNHRKRKLEAARSVSKVSQREGKAGGIPAEAGPVQSWGRAWWMEGHPYGRGKAENPPAPVSGMPSAIFHGFKNATFDSEEVTITLKI